MIHRTGNTHAVLSAVIIGLSLLWTAVILVSHSTLYTTPFNAQAWKRAYERSQWMDPRSKAPIGDDGLYAYAGYRYIQGDNPILINPETPPLGKYLIGLSIIIFHNQRVMSVIAALASLALIFFIAKQLNPSPLGGSIAVCLTALNSIFIDQYTTAPQLDIFQLMFLLLFMYLYIWYIRKKTTILLVAAGITLGMFLSIKVLVMFFVLMNAFLLLYSLLKKKPIKQILYELGVLNFSALFTFTLLYLQFFMHGGTLRGFAGTQKWVYHFYSQSQIQSPALYGSYLTLIFANKWRVWSAGFPYVSYDQWSIVWPIVTVAGVTTMVLILKNRIKDTGFMLLFAFLIVYNVFLFFVPLFPRYLLLLFVPWDIVIGFYIASLFHE